MVDEVARHLLSECNFVTRLQTSEVFSCSRM
jgi:hypothetical protein